MKVEGKGRGLANFGGGHIELTEDAVTIYKKSGKTSGSIAGALFSAATTTKGAYSVPYSGVTSVSISKGGFLSHPFIQILSGGERAITDVDAAIESASCLLFKSDALGQFEALKREIEERRSQASKSTSVGSTGTLSVADEVEKLASLLSKGLISEGEFQEQKKKLLAR